MGAEKSKYQIENANGGAKSRQMESAFKRTDSTSKAKRNSSSNSQGAPAPVAASPAPAVSESDIRTVRSSWRELTKTEEFKQHGLKYYGLNMMIKYHSGLLLIRRTLSSWWLLLVSFSQDLS